MIEKIVESTETDKKSIQEQIAAKAKELEELEHQIDQVSAISEDNKDLDDAGSEAADDEVQLAIIRRKMEDLRREISELEAQLNQ